MKKKKKKRLLCSSMINNWGDLEEQHALNALLLIVLSLTILTELCDYWTGIHSLYCGIKEDFVSVGVEK